MATPEILDFDKLCEPIAKSQPTGPYLRDATETAMKWSEFEDARRNARAAEKARLEADPNLPPPEAPDWGEVRTLGEGLLARSKDLWVVAGMIDALTREYGIAGVRDGY
ncbi:MAG: type VI secretion system ImpA family N-terminal domain-containing protein, partial [Planctomycetaceae bacterium]|nr:type VI secretion system ImpA family N-terminal domain-containing protein [Planctomycetaceae bacterium]